MNKLQIVAGKFAMFALAFAVFASLRTVAEAAGGPTTPYNVPPEDTGLITDIIYVAGGITSTVGVAMLATVKTISEKISQ